MRGDENKQGRESPAPTLTEQAYAELRRLAAWYIASESPGHTLQPTALVNEVYVRLAPGLHAEGLTRPQFMALAARVMRNVLVDHARRQQAAKRGGQAGAAGAAWRRIPLEQAQSPEPFCASPDILALHEALERLARLSERQARVVEARFFAGLSVEQTAEALGVSPRTVESDWAVARAWLARELSGATVDSEGGERDGTQPDPGGVRAGE